MKEFTFEPKSSITPSTPIKDDLSMDGGSIRKRPRMSSPPTPAKEKQSSVTRHNQKPSGSDDDEQSQSGTLDRSRSNTPSPHATRNKSLLAIENKQLEVLQVVLYVNVQSVEQESGSGGTDVDSVSKGRLGKGATKKSGKSDAKKGNSK